MQFEIAIRASQGARRSQEDSALSWPRTGEKTDDAARRDLPPAETGRLAAVLCDGMGGHIGGAMASRTACENFLPSLVGEDGGVRDRLMRALEQANVALTDQINRNPSYSGMGSTLVGIETNSDGLSWISVGDSLLYLWRRGEIALLNADHSLAPEIDRLAESGRITWAAARADPRRHYLRSALTGDEIEMIDLSEQPAPLEAGDVVLLASDGLNTLETDSIAQIVTHCCEKGADTIAHRLIETIDRLAQPHQDNTTVVAIRVLAGIADDHV